MILLILYSLLLILATVWWLSVQAPVPEKSDERVTVIVVVRNEEKNIIALLESLRAQTHRNLEVLLVNDQSTDRTVEYAESLQLKNLHIIPLRDDERGTAPKKAGIEKAIQLATGNIIVTTDGDCVLPPGLISFYAGLFLKKDVQMLVGPVTFTPGKGVWNQIQTVEFASLIGSSATALFLRKPIMCSAANLAYRKSAFLETGGYSDNSGRASGDDEFLMNKIHDAYPEGLKFVKSKACIVATAPTKTLASFFQQRKRWAGKWRDGQNFIAQATAVLIFLVNAYTIWFLFTGKWQIVLFRFLTEIGFLSAILIFFERRKAILFIPLTQLVYPFYAVFFGLVSLIPSSYTWKERRLK